MMSVLKAEKKRVYELAILAAASLSAALCIAGAEIVVFHIVLVLSTSKIALLATSLLATLLALAGASWRLLATFLAFVMTSTTHVSL
jgi:hypothetical protein